VISGSSVAVAEPVGGGGAARRLALGHAWFGILLVLADGIGMAATLTGVGLLLAHLRGRVDRRLLVPAASLLARAGRSPPR
jgi:uridylate kinase